MNNGLNNNYYYCYSYKLKNFILANNIRFICSGINNKTNKKYWLFERCVNLSKVLEKWKLEKPGI